jgi:hypothetical protein
VGLDDPAHAPSHHTDFMIPQVTRKYQIVDCHLALPTQVRSQDLFVKALLMALRISMVMIAVKV